MVRIVCRVGWRTLGFFAYCCRLCGINVKNRGVKLTFSFNLLKKFCLGYHFVATRFHFISSVLGRHNIRMSDSQDAHGIVRLLWYLETVLLLRQDCGLFLSSMSFVVCTSIRLTSGCEVGGEKCRLTALHCHRNVMRLWVRRFSRKKKHCSNPGCNPTFAIKISWMSKKIYDIWRIIRFTCRYIPCEVM